MKTQENILKSLIMGVFILIATISLPLSAQNTQTYKQYNGTLQSAETGEAIVFATVYVQGSNIGTVSNSEGEFSIKIPNTISTGQLILTHVGYKKVGVNISSLQDKDNVIKLEPERKSIDEITVRSDNPVKLLQLAIEYIPKNYPSEPDVQRAFYRETIKKNRRYVAILEAVTDIYKTPYAKPLHTDRISVFKGRKSRDVEKMDTVLFKLQGGATTALLLDIVKNPYYLITPDNYEYYNYSLDGVVSINDNLAYQISFDQIDGIDVPLYKGNIYIDVETMAVAGAEYGLSPKGLSKADEYLVRKKPLLMDIETLGANYLVSYRPVNGKWVLNYVRAETGFKCKWKRKIFASNYYVMTEMAITDRNTADPESYNKKTALTNRQILVDKIDDFQDDEFWGADNTIKPDDSIENAIKRLGRKY